MRPNKSEPCKETKGQNQEKQCEQDEKWRLSAGAKEQKTYYI